VTLKPTASIQTRVANLVKKTGITRHNILLRLINLGLEQVEKDKDSLFTPSAIGTEEDGEEEPATKKTSRTEKK
jgi:hypothetical protein